MKPRAAEEKSNSKPRQFIEGIDYYFENGLMVLTGRFLLERGYCCGNGCRHCPYQTEETKAATRVSPNPE